MCVFKEYIVGIEKKSHAYEVSFQLCMQPQHKNVNSAFQSLIDLKHRSIKIDTIAHKIETEKNEKEKNKYQATPVRMVISSGHSARFSSLFHPPTRSYSDYKPFITHCIIFIRCPLYDSYEMNDEVFLVSCSSSNRLNHCHLLNGHFS